MNRPTRYRSYLVNPNVPVPDSTDRSRQNRRELQNNSLPLDLEYLGQDDCNQPNLEPMDFCLNNDGRYETPDADTITYAENNDDHNEFYQDIEEVMDEDVENEIIYNNQEENDKVIRILFSYFAI